MRSLDDVVGIRQWLIGFKNGYGASVIRGPHSYGGPQGLYELAVLKRDYHRYWNITYDTPITDEVLGSLEHEDVFWDEEANDIQFDYEDLYDALNNDDIFDIQKALYELTYL